MIKKDGNALSVSHKNIVSLQKRILTWYEDNARQLPWRETTNPYNIWVSEIMLQQTQVERVIPKYFNFLKSFPTIKNLAQADKKELLLHRSWLGFNSRALNMQKTAQIVTSEYGERMPNDLATLKSFPWIGPYTAGAICAFAYNMEIPVVDINIKRVLIHSLGLAKDIGSKELETLAVACIPAGKSREWHNALMDYGSAVLTSKKTGIRSTPQSKFAGSQRQVRGNLLKYLTKHGEMSLEEAKKQFSHEKFDEIVKKMINEGIVDLRKWIIYL